MTELGISTLQSRPGILKELDLSKIVDRRKHQDVGYFISAKYGTLLEKVFREIERRERREKLQRLRGGEDLEFLESGVDDGLAKG